MDNSFIQYRINLMNQWEAPIVQGLQSIASTYRLYDATIKTRRNPWYKEAWCIYATVMDETGRIPLRFRVGIEFYVSTGPGPWPLSFRVISPGEDVEGSIGIHDEFSSLEEALAFIRRKGPSQFATSC